MKYLWDKKLSKGTKVKLITRKNRRFSAVKGIVISHKEGELEIKGADGKVYIRHEPQKIFKEMKTLLKLITEVEMMDRITIKVPKNFMTGGLSRQYFDGAQGSIIGMEKDKNTKMYRVKFDKPVMIPDVGEVSSDLFPANWLKKT